MLKEILIKNNSIFGQSRLNSVIYQCFKYCHRSKILSKRKIGQLSNLIGKELDSSDLHAMQLLSILNLWGENIKSFIIELEDNEEYEACQNIKNLYDTIFIE